MPLEITQSLAENLVCGMRFYGLARPTGEIRDLPSHCLIYSGLNYAAFNAAVLRAPHVQDSRELMRLIEEARAFYEPRGVRWTYWLCEAALDRALVRELPAIFQRCGLNTLTEAPGMYAEPSTLQVAEPELVEVRPTSDATTREAFARIITKTFSIPQAVSTAIYESERAWKGDFRGYVGYVDSKPVTTTATVGGGGVTGLYSVATLPAHRRKGYAAATMRAALRQQGGQQPTVLQSTQEGLLLYEKMGYRVVTTFRVFITG